MTGIFYPSPSRFIATLGSADPVFSSTHLAMTAHTAVPATSTAKSVMRIAKAPCGCSRWIGSLPNPQMAVQTAQPPADPANKQRPISTKSRLARETMRRW